MLGELSYLARRIAQEKALMEDARSLGAVHSHAVMALAYQRRHAQLMATMEALL